MREKFILLAAFALCGTLASAANILKNGELIEKDSNGFAQHWQIWPKKLSDKVSVRLDNTNSKSGGQSVAINHTSEHRYTRIDQLHVPCKPHTKYVARFWAKGQNITTTQKGGARMFIGPNGDLNRPLIQFGPGLEQFKKNITSPWTFGWTLFESNVFSSGSSKELGVTLYFRNASGTIWFDDIEIVEYTANEKLNREAERARSIIRKDIEHIAAIAPELKGDLEKAADDTEKFFPTIRDPRQGMPFFAPQRELGRIFSRILQKKFNTQDIVVSQAADPLQQQSAFFIPQSPAPAKITLSGLKNEVEAFALNLTNPAAASKSVKITVPENLELTAYRVVHVETDRKAMVDDALLPLKFNENNTCSVKVPAGMTYQIYFTVQLKFAKDGVININGKPINIECRPRQTRYPGNQHITLFAYAYPYRFGFVEKLDEARKLRFAMHNNGAMPYQFCTPLPYFNEKGKFISSKMNWGKLDTILAMTPKPHKLIIPLPVHTASHTRESLGTNNGEAIALFSAEWERRLSIWLRSLTAGLAKRNITYNDFALALIDEPTANSIEYMKKVVTLIRKIDKNLRIYNNFNHCIPHNNIAEFASYLDIVSPEIAEMSPDKMKILKDSGKEIWAYHVQNRSYPANQMRDNFAFFNKENIKGFSYWCFYDNSPRWQPTGGQSYAIFYDDADNTWHPSKRAEGIREGVELYELLTLLKEKNLPAYKNLCSQIGKIPGNELRRIALQYIE